MNSVLSSLIIIAVFIAFVGTIITVIIKFLFFRKHHDTYMHILKIGLFGELLGIIIMYVVAYFDKPDDQEELLAIPFYFMLLGLLIGTILIYLKKRKEVQAN